MDKISDFEKLLFPLPDGFADTGMDFLGISDRTSASGTVFRTFSFLNKVSQTSMDISVSSAAGSVVVHIACQDAASFTVERFFESKGRHDEWIKNWFKKDPATIISYLNNLMKTELHDILVGKERLEIPFDWTTP